MEGDDGGASCWVLPFFPFWSKSRFENIIVPARWLESGNGVLLSRARGTCYKQSAASRVVLCSPKSFVLPNSRRRMYPRAVFVVQIIVQV